jgi:hypothetical protein
MATTLDVNVNNSQALRALDQISSKLQQVGTDFQNVFSSAKSTAQGLAATLIAVGAATAAFADEISDVAAANGTTIATVLGLSKALEQAGGKGESVGRMFQTLSNNIDGANQGNEKTITAFNRLGVSMGDLGSLTQSEINGKVIKSLAAMQDITARNALAQEILGKAALGVNWKAYADGVDENTKKYEEFEPAVQTAGDAFDKMKSIMGDLKVAFAVAFEPLFKYIANLKVEIPDIVKGLNLMAAALALVTSAAVLGGMIKLIELFKVLTTVVSKNPLVAIAMALLSVGTGVAAYLGLTKEQVAAQEEVTKKVEDTSKAVKKVTNDQSGYNEKIAKAREGMEKIGQQLDQNFKFAQSKYDLDIKSLSLNEQEKKIAQDRGDIEKQTQTALTQLEATRASQSALINAATQDAYNKEKQAIIDKGETQKKIASDRITQLMTEQSVIKDLQSATNIYGSMYLKLTENNYRAQIPLMATLNERIDAETKLSQIQQLRQALIAQTSKLSEKDRADGVAAVELAVGAVNLQTTSQRSLNLAVQDQIEKLVATGKLSQDNADIILAGSEQQRNAISATSREFVKQQQILNATTSTFSYGWSTAMNDFVIATQNGADAAKNIIGTMTKGLEDSFVKFVETGKLSFKDLVNSLIADIARSQIRSLLGNLIGGPGAAATDSLGNMFKSLLGFANGGMIPTNRPVLVGERGPEILSGVGGRMVTPNDALGGGAQYVTYNISAVDAMSFKSMIARDPSFIHAVAQQGARSMPARR